ncbi:MAG: hypothetical protein ACK4TA_20740, partial [Saprospiraceae bacterium]
ITLLTALLLLALHQLPSLQAYLHFSWWSLAFFVFFCILTYLIAYRAVHRKNKFAFINAALVLTFIKMLLCVVVVGAYIKLANPPSRLFILPFLGIYVVYTIFETYFMMKIGKTK